MQRNHLKTDYSPIMGLKYSKEDYLLLDLSVENAELPLFDSPDMMTDYIKSNLTAADKKLAYGGYLEKRNLYQSDLFLSQGPIRDIHLGVDVWCDALTPIYCPYEGQVYSIAYNGNALDYGYTLIIQHSDFYTLYGHLSHHINDMWKIGQSVQQSKIIAYTGEPHENGGWSPHIHFQVMKDMNNNIGDYPGVCAEADLAYYSDNCPDPIDMVLP